MNYYADHALTIARQIAAALEVPEHAALIQRVLAIPYKRVARRLVGYLTQEEVVAILASVDQSTRLVRSSVNATFIVIVNR